MSTPQKGRRAAGRSGRSGDDAHELHGDGLADVEDPVVVGTAHRAPPYLRSWPRRTPPLAAGSPAAAALEEASAPSADDPGRS